MSFWNHDAVAVLGIPDVAVRELVDVGLELTIVVVRISNEELYDEPSMTLPTQYNVRGRAVFYLGLKSPRAHRTNF